MQILTYPNPALDKVCVPVSKVTLELIDTAKEMYRLMKAANGIGLAANQCGLEFRIIVMDCDGPMYLFNPVILKRSSKLVYGPEACLSYPGITRLIKRPEEVTIKYRDQHNKMAYAVFKGIHSRCLIHEMQHLEGHNFLDEGEEL